MGTIRAVLNGQAITKTMITLAGLVFIISSAIRWQNLAFIPEQVFDEVHYVKAAEVLVGVKTHPGMGVWADHPQIGKSPAPNFEHPLLGKFLIGWGIRVFGNEAWGWRFFSCLFGTLNILLMGALAWQFFKNQWLSLFTMVLIGFDSMHILFSRIAMLDIFLNTAMIGLLCAALHLLKNPDSIPARVFAAVAIAFGFSTKWVFSVAIIAFCWQIIFLMPGALRHRLKILAQVGGLALGLYHLWYLYYLSFGFSYLEWLQFQLAASQVTAGKLAPHPYEASALSMLFNQRNIWLYFKQLPDHSIAAIVCLMNPILIFSTIPAFLVIFVHYFKNRNRSDIFLLGFFSICYGLFFMILLQRQGFIYYMLLLQPIIILGLGRAWQILSQKRRIKLSIFLYSLLFLVASGFFLPAVLGLPLASDWYLLLIKFTGI